MEQTHTFVRWLCYSHYYDGFRMNNGMYTKDVNKAKVYLRKPSKRSYPTSANVTPFMIECTIDLASLTYTKISGTES